MAAARNKPSTELSERVAAFFAPRLADGRRVCVALSGGRDSVALLHALADSREQLPQLEVTALHVHHNLSAHADDWAGFCGDLCRSLAVPLSVARVKVVDSGNEGLEAAARRARYAAFAGCAADWLALAHHRDDQAETLLLNLLRGAGVRGLAAMPEERPLPGTTVRLVRPLLPIARQEIDAWLRTRGAAWVEDDSNIDTRLRRNFIRSDVMPVLASAFPDPVATLARTAAHLADHAVLSTELALIDAKGVIDGGTICLRSFNSLPPTRRDNLLRHYLRQHGLRMPDARYLAEIVRQLADAAADAAPVLPIDCAELRVFRGRLHVCAAEAGRAEGALTPLVWDGRTATPWANGVLRPMFADGVGLSRQRLAGGKLTVRQRVGGERLQPDPARPRRALKKLLQASAMPVWVRARLPLLWCDGQLVWVAGIGCDEQFAAAPGEAGMLPIWEAG